MSDSLKDFRTALAQTFAEDEKYLAALSLIAKIGKANMLLAFKARFSHPRNRTGFKDIAKQSKLRPQELSSALAVATILLGVGPKPPDQEPDPYGLVLDDLQKAGLIEESVGVEVKAVLESVCQQKTLLAAADYMFVAEKQVGTALPVLDGMWVRCVQIQRFDPEFSLDSVPEEYNPKMRKPFVALNIQMDIDFFGETKRVSFALLPYEVDEMILRLQLGVKQLKLLSEAGESAS